MNALDNILLIANPVAKSGRGADAAQQAFKLLNEKSPGTVDLFMTERAGQAAEVVAGQASRYSAVIALGGDGVIHEVANGLMASGCTCRTLGVIPVGSGNDYARTLGMSEKVDEAVGQILAGRLHSADLGCVNGAYFTETLSMGLCAAIALGTMERRKISGKSGTLLYLEEGIDQLLHHFAFHPFRLEVLAGPDAGAVREGSAILTAIQNGPTYGGGFKICPDADFSDGLLDICVASGDIGKLHAVKVFLSAKNGGHAGHRIVEFLRASELRIVYSDAPKCQVDGEALEADEYHIRVVHDALRVFAGSE